MPQPLDIQSVPIDAKCTGSRWSAHDEELARLIAIIAMGQAVHAAHLLKGLLPATPALKRDCLSKEAKITLTVQDDDSTTQTGYPKRNGDGFIFEAISWIAARQPLDGHTLFKGPHISATSQRLDGLMIEVADDKSKIVKTTVFEDKCTDKMRKTFRKKVIPTLLKRHNNERSAELMRMPGPCSPRRA